jgi:hypothetical protein
MAPDGRVALFEPTLDVQGRHAAAPGRRNGLAVPVIGKIARREDTLDTCSRGASLGQYVTLGVEGDLVPQDIGVRDVPDGNEDAPHIQKSFVSGLNVAEPEPLNSGFT